ncbi:DUF4962 domain-containing protein [Paenibacillus soyae]|uniref:DUF4962 domain-containing protein n=1 Tax=Paenibacillus soyae TaxID=2969249 RepID=A0A9X2S8Q3_9BACL|nr:DUF4962 domain-containing protein [Paenibacillus soyae]MCR2802688.1 DUF4962 domain-containing protein [Paenibacillus soyae]
MDRTLNQPESSALSVQYSPTEETKLLENPPRFTWMAADSGERGYMLQWSTTPSFEEGATVLAGPVKYPFYTPDVVLDPGFYYWRYAAVFGKGELSEWSRVRSFNVEEALPETPLPDPIDRYRATREDHPRLWLNAEQIVEFRKRLQEDESYCSWPSFYEGSVLPWLERELISEPLPYPGNKRVAKLWRKMYMDCQETLYAIRHMSVAGVILQDRRLLNRAKEWLLHVCAWDPEGPTSRDYNDEAAFRIAAAVAWGYDWLYGELTGEERQLVREVLLRRTGQVACHVIESSRIHSVPYDSHAVRSLSSVLVPCCLAMLFENDSAAEWLNYTMDYYSALYTPWGGADGGWAEGPMYWTTGLAYVTEAFNLLRNATNVDYYKRPFFQRTGDFPLYCFSPDTTRASFCDQSTLGDPPSLKTAFLMRQFAGITGNGTYQWYYEQIRTRETFEEADQKFYNYGWWDFRFDEMLYLHDFEAVQAVEPADMEAVKWFRDIGWVAMHACPTNPKEHIMLLTKSSRYGSVSHSHGDQNAFVLHAYGEALAVQSGYYVAFGSTMHLNWRRQTRSKNVLLFDGKGQYGGRDKTLNLEASGRIEEAWHKDGVSYTRADATAAYQHEVPYLRRFVREYYFIDNAYIVVVDYVDFEQPASLTWLMHTPYEMELNGQTFRAVTGNAELLGRFVYCSSGDLELSQTNQYEEVDTDEIEGMPSEWHLHAVSGAAISHRLVTLLVPMKRAEEKLVTCEVEETDDVVHLRFTCEGNTTSIEVRKS